MAFGGRISTAAGAGFVACALLATSQASALIVIDPSDPGFGSPDANTTAPTGQFPNFTSWDNVIGLHTYLGDGYLLHAAHAGSTPASIMIQGQQYNRVALQQLHAPGDAGTLSDLVVWKVEPAPGVPALPNLPGVLPIQTAPQVAEGTLLIGDGAKRDANLTQWAIAAQPGDNDDVWTATTDPLQTDARGFLAVNSAVKRWGTNTVFDPSASATFESLGTTTEGFTTEFSLVGATSDEAQASGNDSSGPVFIERGGQWQLAGLMHAVGLFDGQPTAPNVSAILEYRGPDGLAAPQASETFASDLSQYLDQLAAFGVTVPEPSIVGALMPGLALLARRGRRVDSRVVSGH